MTESRIMSLVRVLAGGHRLRLCAAVLLYFAFASALLANQASKSTPENAGGGLATVRADSQEKDKNLYHFRGHVQLNYQDMRITADEASIDYDSGEVIAQGHVTFDDPMSHLTAEEVHYNVRTRKGWFSNGVGYVHAKGPSRPRVLKSPNPFYLTGDQVDRVDDETYVVSHGTLTSCDCASRGWLLSVGRARVNPGDKVVAHNVVFRFLGVPIFYLPIIADSLAREPRHTGFLLPHIGNSTQKGYIVGAGFFWAVNPSVDMTFGVEDYSKRGFAERFQFRAKPSENAEFSLNAFGLKDTTTQQETLTATDPMTLQTISVQAPLSASGVSIHAFGKDDDIGDGFRAVTNVDYVNSMKFRITWSPSYSEAVDSEAVQSGFVSKNWSTYSFNVYAERYQDFLATQPTPTIPQYSTTAVLGPTPNVIIRHLPSVDFSGEDREIGHTPLYLSFQASADLVGRTQDPAQNLSIPLLSDRIDFHPEIMLRSREFWHFHFNPYVGFRATRYGASLLGKHTPVDRLLGEVGFDLRPPSFERIFDKTYRGYRLKHVIEPDIQYHLARAHDPDNILDIVRFDALDIFTETNEVEYSLTSTILGRKDVPDDSTDVPQARDLFSWRLSQKYYFDPTFGNALVRGQNNVFDATIDVTGFAFEHGQRFSPVDSVFKFAPFSNYDTEIRTDLNPEGAGSILDAGITSRVKHGIWGVSLTDFFINRSSYFSALEGGTQAIPETSLTPLDAYHLLGSVITYGDTSRRGLSAAIGADYNFQQKIFQHAISQVSYNFGCFALDVEYQYYDLGNLRRESQFRVALSLANVGTFGNLKPHDFNSY
jgi:LPS-assembly protein